MKRAPAPRKNLKRYREAAKGPEYFNRPMSSAEWWRVVWPFEGQNALPRPPWLVVL